MTDNIICSIKHSRRTPVICIQKDSLRIRELIGKINDITYFGTPEPVNTLVVITDNAYKIIPVTEHFKKRELSCI